jgi:hypothetical protein
MAATALCNAHCRQAFHSSSPATPKTSPKSPREWRGPALGQFTDRRADGGCGAWRCARGALGDGRYLAAARKLETAFARRDGVAEIAALVVEVIGEHSTAARR